MKTIIFFGVLLMSVCGAHAQRDKDRDIQDSVIGWSVKNKYDHFKPQTEPLAKKKEAVVNEMVKWMKASYTPVGGIGTSQRYIGPIGYGVAFDVWNVSHDGIESNGEFKPIPEENTHFYMEVNRMYGAWPISFVNTGSEFYFTMQPDGYGDNDQLLKSMQGADPRIHPNCSPYITWRNEMIQVFLSPNNKLPWKVVSKGELLDRAEAGLQRVIADKRKEVEEHWPDKKGAQDEVMVDFMKEVDKYRGIIHTLRQRHGSSLNQPAVVSDYQVDFRSFKSDPDFFTIDAFSAARKHAYPVYKLDSVTYAKLKNLEPQWVCIAWPFESKEGGNQLFEMYTAMSQHINYEYIYDYFYAPEKIKGRAYAPANEEGLKARLAAFRATRSRNEGKVAAKGAGLKEGVLLYDDFSQEAEGSKPAGWFYNSYGQANIVSTVPGERGKWLKLGYNSIITSTTVKVLPEDFNLEFDLVTGAFDGRWGADVLIDLTGKKDKFSSGFTVEIGAGNQAALEAGHDYRGVLRASMFNSPSSMPYNDIGGFYEFAQPEFTSGKRKVHVQLVKKGDGIRVLLNGKEYANSAKFKTKYGNKDCGDCSIQPGLQYQRMQIKSLTQDAAATGCYIGNIKISR